jgi:hypothetical protein
MSILIFLLRLIHILAGVFWAGTTLVMASHISPSVKAAGAEGQKFMQQFAAKSSLSKWMAITGSLTFLAGIVLYFIITNRQYPRGNPQGDYLLGGMIIGTLAYLHGATAQRGTILKMQKLGGEIAAGGKPPTAEQTSMMQTYSQKIERNGIILAYMLALTIIIMATFQYFTF